MTWGLEFEFGIDYLDIILNHDYRQTQEEKDALRRIYRKIFSEKAGKPVEDHEFTALPVGETPVLSIFRIRLDGRKGYLTQAAMIHNSSPTVIPRLIEDLRRYQRDVSREPEVQLVQAAINGFSQVLRSD